MFVHIRLVVSSCFMFHVGSCCCMVVNILICYYSSMHSDPCCFKLCYVVVAAVSDDPPLSFQKPSSIFHVSPLKNFKISGCQRPQILSRSIDESVSDSASVALSVECTRQHQETTLCVCCGSIASSGERTFGSTVDRKLGTSNSTVAERKVTRDQ